MTEKKPKIILGIETSCDETAAAIVTSDRKIKSNIIASQIDEHQKHGGVVPEIAARAHLSVIDSVIKSAMTEAKVDYCDLDAIAATAGPGLIGGVIVGTVTAKAIAAATKTDYYAINHLEGHALTPRLTNKVDFPYLLLLVSGGHTQIIEVIAPDNYIQYGTTIDDAAGEAFDKTAKTMGLGLPGGPLIEELATGGDAREFNLPIPMQHKKGCDFSFSGLKTALVTHYEKMTENEKIIKKTDLAAAMQNAIALTLKARCKNAMKIFKEKHQGHKHFVVAGGVAANIHIRNMLKTLANDFDFNFAAPPINLCTDNAAMIAWAAAEKINANIKPSNINAEPKPRWPLDPNALTQKGSKL